MVAYNFMKQFARDVETGKKNQTIRAPRKKSRHARVGEPVQLYTGMRSPSCRKLVDPDPYVTAVWEIIISENSVYDKSTGNFSQNPDVLRYFAKSDGFESWEAMRDWFDQVHGLPFTGVLIKWRWSPNAESD